MAHTERVERFEEAIYKQRDKINKRMTEMFCILKEFTKGKSLEKVLVREDFSKPVTKYVNAISLVRIENDKGKGGDKVVDKSIMEPIELIENKEEIDDIMDNESDGSDFQDSHDDEEDTRSSQEYKNDLEMDFHKRALLAKSKRTTVPSNSSPFQNNPQLKFISSSHQHKPELRPTKVFDAKYNKVKAKLALLSAGASTSKSFHVKNHGLISKAYEWDEEEVSSDENEIVEVKVLISLADDESGVVGKESDKMVNGLRSP
ncbi:hypothetical protein Tco_0461854 [Tanacetum coccineum]